MGAPAGNQFWRLRSKHGRDKLFATPALMLEAVEEYFIWCDEHPFEELDYRGKDATPVILKKMRPYTMQGLTSYLQTNVQYFNEFKQSLAGKSTAEAKDFSAVIAHIEGTIYNQKFSGAAAGFFNANIIARDLGLSDKQEIKQDVNVSQKDLMHKLDDDTLQKLLEAAGTDENKY